MAQAQRILGHRVVEFGARGSAPSEHQRLVASERAHPVARRRLAGGERASRPADRRAVRHRHRLRPATADAPSRKWRCESISPGATMRPASRIRCVRGPTSGFRSPKVRARGSSRRRSRSSRCRDGRGRTLVQDEVSFEGHQDLKRQDARRQAPDGASSRAARTSTTSAGDLSPKTEAAWLP